MVLGEQKLTFIGPGVMAEAMVSALISNRVVGPAQIVMNGPRPKKLEMFTEKYQVLSSTDNRSAVAEADIIIISVKPQSVFAVMKDLQGSIPANALILSIVAGLPLSTLVAGFDHPAIVRAMPNTPAQVGQGITVWTSTLETSDSQRDQSRVILGAFGEELYVEEEDYLDMATAVSGTGPAYVYLFMEAMVDAGVHLGFPRRIAEQLVVQTVRGSVAFYDHSALHLARLRNQVTSPGGTSAAALYYLDKAGFRTALSRAIWAAYERSVSLGRGQKAGRLDNQE